MIQQKVFDLLNNITTRNTEDLKKALVSCGYFEAPASTSYHLSVPGGTAEHSLNVCEMMLDLNRNIADISRYISFESIIIAGLLHDVGKAAYRGKKNYIENVLKSGQVSATKPYISNPERLHIPHEIVSILIVNQVFDLTEEEEFAILYHNGLYVPSGREIQGKERPLQQLLHYCDMWCSRFIEGVPENES